MQMTLEQFLTDASEAKCLLAYTYKHYDDSNNMLVDAHSFVSCVKLNDKSNKLVLLGTGNGGAWMTQTLDIGAIVSIDKTTNGRTTTYQLTVGENSHVTLERDF